MTLYFRSFSSPLELSNYVSDQKIKKENIQQIVFDQTYNKTILYYWV